jgi:hypothetical protein
LREQLLVEKRKSEKIAHEKKELEGELENLSQALFEEVRIFFFFKSVPLITSIGTSGKQDGIRRAHQACRSGG